MATPPEGPADSPVGATAVMDAVDWCLTPFLETERLRGGWQVALEATLSGERVVGAFSLNFTPRVCWDKGRMNIPLA